MFNKKKGVILSFIILLSCLCSCSKNNGHGESLYKIVPKKHTHVNFSNIVGYTEEYNTYTYRNFYNGAGVGIGDVNNDGLPDIYFCGNLTDNRLYLNKGNFVFEDITSGAGVASHGSWSTGVTMADINGDGFLDIYVCKSGRPDVENRHNQLFINNGNLTFTEKAREYGLDIKGLSNHAAFFDYDHDGDLDCYMLSNSFVSVTEFDIMPGQRNIPDSLGGNRLFRNDEGHFTDVTKQSCIFGSKIGFGLGVSIADVNRDGWQDIYVANDFFERDYLYINNHDGTFKESLENQLREISLGAMGADIADLNNDGWPEIFVTEMTPEDIPRARTKAVYESWDRYRMKVRKGYHYQFPRNTLQLNNRDNSFSETGRFSGVSKTDWSWGALIMDMDNDGWNDIFITNGIYKDLLDRDFLDMYSDPSMMRSIMRTSEKAILQIIDAIPSVMVPNYAFHNNADMTFANNAEAWGLDEPSFSNGAAYGDIDNDGDLDLVVNNVNMDPFIYRNEIHKKQSGRNYLTLKLRGKGKNTNGLGASATIYTGTTKQWKELSSTRGFQSSSDNRLHFGLGNTTKADSVVIRWTDGSVSVLYDLATNQILTVSQEDSKYPAMDKAHESDTTVFRESVIPNGFDFRHHENDFVDFDRDKLIFGMLSNEGPHMAITDVDKNGMPDIFICGAKGEPGALFCQNAEGRFKNSGRELFEKDSISEDTDCIFFDADNDGDMDLCVASGGNEFPSSSSALADRLYTNNGKGEFSLAQGALPQLYESTSCLRACDYDMDGDMDLFTGTRLVPFAYGLPAGSHLLENDGKGHFTDVTSEKAPYLQKIGMVTDMSWADVDNDKDDDIVLAGEWMPVEILINTNGKFNPATKNCGLEETAGFWHRIAANDLNGDGLIDFILGNNGLNNIFKATPDKPLLMYVNDFDMNGSIEQLICIRNGSKEMPLAMKDDLVSQIPSLRTRYSKFSDYSNQGIEDIFPKNILERSVMRKAILMQTCVLINKGDCKFEIVPLPAAAQLSPVYAIVADDFNKDGIEDIILGGNQYRCKPEVGINDASYGVFLKGEPGNRWTPLSSRESGLFIKGEIRDFKIIKSGERMILAAAMNDDKPKFFEY